MVFGSAPARERNSRLTETRGSPSTLRRFMSKVVQTLAGYRVRAIYFGLSNAHFIKFLRTVSSVVRYLRPILIIRNSVFLARHEDVCEVMERMGEFSSADGMNPKMPAGPFVLSIDWKRQHERERRALERVVDGLRQKDEERIRTIARVKSRSVIDAALGRTAKPVELNVARDLSEDTALEVVKQYLGVPAPEGREEEFRQWMRILAAQIFHRPPVGSLEEFRTSEASAELVVHIKALISCRHDGIKQSGDQKIAFSDDLLVRLLKQIEPNGKDNPWLDEAWVLRLVAGMMVAGTATVARAMTQGIYQVFRQPGALSAVRDAATKYASLDNGSAKPGEAQRIRDRMLQVCYEAIRFNPMLPAFSARYCLRETVVASGKPQERLIDAGASVLPVALAGMFDPQAFPRPGQFCPDRPMTNYLHFGRGPHACFGKFVADSQFVEVFSQLFRHQGLRLKPGSDGRISYEGPAVDKLIVQKLEE